MSVTPHRSLNSTRGVTRSDDLLDSSENEILDGLKAQGVAALEHITMHRDGIKEPSKHLILTFDRHTLPTSV